MKKELIELIANSMPLLMQGAWMTIKVLACSMVMSFTLGLFFGMCICNRLKIRYLSLLIEGVFFVIRAIPFYVQLLIVYFVLPDLININLDSFAASILALGVCSSAYMAQLVRCGTDSIPIDQWETAQVLGYSTYDTVRTIILPQMGRNVLPAITNEVESLLKSTSILASIGMLELTRMGQNIISREMEPLAIYLTVALFYVCISFVINRISKKVEARLRYAYN